VVLAASLPVLAQEKVSEQPIIRARIETPTPVMVGETVVLSVDVLTPSWFPRAPRFPAALDVENAVAVFDESFRVNLSERIGNDGWAGIQRRYLIHPQLGGAYAVPSIDVEVVYALPSARASDPVTLTAPALRFEARVPPEAAGLGYFIAAKGFTLRQSVDPEPEGLRVGDAVTRTITMSASEASSMMLPITVFPSIDGLSVYPEPSRSSDRGGERGSAREARRVDAATYVLETEGTYELPEIRRSWWDVSAGRLRETSVPAVVFGVAPNPDLAAEIALPEEPADGKGAPVDEGAPPWRRRAELGAALAVLAFVGWIARRHCPALGARLAASRRLRRDSEAASFKRVVAASRRNDPHGTMRALFAWVDRVTPPGQSPTVHRLLAKAADPELSGAVSGLEAALYGSADPAGWRGQGLARLLERARRAGRAAGIPRSPALLAPLNPPA